MQGFNYVGMGNSTNKKDASINAARDFLMFLVRTGELNSSELPFNSPNQTTPSTSSVQSMPPPPHTLPFMRPDMISGIPSQPKQGFIAYPEGPKQEYIDRIAQKRKFEEAEELDVNSGIHGNWTLDNAKQQLHQFLQVNKMVADYKYTAVGPDHNRYFD